MSAKQVDIGVNKFFSQDYASAAMVQFQPTLSITRSNAGLTDTFLGSEYNIKAALSSAFNAPVMDIFRPNKSSNAWISVATGSIDKSVAKGAENAIQASATAMQQLERFKPPSLADATQAENDMNTLRDAVNQKNPKGGAGESKRMDVTRGPVRIYSDENENENEDEDLTKLADDVLQYEAFVRKYAVTIDQQIAKDRPLAEARKRLQGIRSRSSDAMQALEEVLLDIEESLNQPPSTQRQQHEDKLRVQLEDAARDADVVLPHS
jgi:hypothetical protein